MQIVIRGTVDDSEGDPIIALPPSLLDRQVLLPPVAKNRREDLQILQFAYMISWIYDAQYPLEVLQGRDPPDRIVRIGKSELPVELTELTISDVRSRFSHARKIGREVEGKLNGNCERYQHLLGRCVQLSISSQIEVPRDRSALTSEICTELLADKGWVGEDINIAFSEPAPALWPDSHRGFYGQFGAVYVQVNSDGVKDRIPVASSMQADIRLSEALSALNRRISEKDIETNTILLITCGLPDEWGCVCPLDEFIFRIIQENFETLDMPPKYLKGVFLHLWGTDEWIDIYRSASYPLAWPPAR